MPLRSDLSDFRGRLQGELFPALAEAVGPLSAKMMQVVTTIEAVALGAYFPHVGCLPGRPLEDRLAIARAFIAKAVLGLSTTSQLIERLHSDAQLRRVCGWPCYSAIPGESTFSRAFAEFADMQLAERAHEALIKATHKDRLVGHVSRDSTAIEAREKPVKVEPEKRIRKKVLPKRGEPGWERLPRLKRQPDMTLAEMLADLPTHCAVGRKPDSKGNTNFWTGYKLHLDMADGGIPLSALLTSASLNDSQVAIPLARLTAERATNLYDLMDSAYDAPEIAAVSRALGHVPIIARQARSNKALKAELRAEARARRLVNHPAAEDVRFRGRSVSERANGRLKDEFGARHVRVRGHAKVMCHLMFGVLALAVDQLMRLIS